MSEHFCQKSLCFFETQWTFEWGLTILKMKIPEHFCQKMLCFFQNQWTFQWGLKILKMKIPEHFCQKILCFLVLCPKPMDFSTGTENFENENSCTFLSTDCVFFENQWTFEWGLKFLKMKILANFCQKSLCFSKSMDFCMGTENFENENS